MYGTMISCLFLGAAMSICWNDLCKSDGPISMASFVCLGVLLATCIDRGIAFLLAAVQAWRDRNESYTAGGPWLVEIREGGAP